MPPLARLLVPTDPWQRMLDHVLASLPLEACGIAAGRNRQVSVIRPIENVARSPVRFRMEPQAQVEALLDLEAQGLELLAVYHSHPSGPPGPSSTDLAEWSYPEAAALIWCSDSGRWQVRAFDLSGPTPIEIEVKLQTGP